MQNAQNIFKTTMFAFSLFVTTYAHSATYDMQKVFSSKQPLTAASVSDDGRTIAFLRSGLETPIELFISHSSKKSQYGKPKLVANNHTEISGTNLHIKNFLTPHDEGSLVNYNGPMTYGKTIVFSALASNNEYGIFYAVPNKKHYIVKALTWQGEPSPTNSDESLVSFDTPYINRDKIYYLAELPNEHTIIVRYDIRDKTKTVILDSENNSQGIKSFFKMSLHNNHLAIRAKKNEQQGIFRLDTKNFKLTQINTGNLKGMEDLSILIGGLSIYDKDISFVAFGSDKAHKEDNRLVKHSAIYLNTAGSGLSKPVVITGQLLPTPKADQFSVIGNPSLYRYKQSSMISFQAYTKLHKKTLGVYIAQLSDKTSYITKLIAPGDKLTGKRVKQASLGPVSIRAMQIPIIVQFLDNTYAIYNITIKK